MSSSLLTMGDLRGAKREFSPGFKNFGTLAQSEPKKVTSTTCGGL